MICVGDIDMNPLVSNTVIIIIAFGLLITGFLINFVPPIEKKKEKTAKKKGK